MKPYLLLGLFVLAGCSSFSTSKDGTLNSIALTQVEQLTMGKSTKQNLENIFGKPSAIVYPNNFESWVYDSDIGESAVFTMDTGGVILSALWIPVAGKSCSNKVCILDYYKNIGFKIENRTEQFGKNESGAYLSYSNQEKGISISFPKGSTEVSDIRFDVPLKDRSPPTGVGQKL